MATAPASGYRSRARALAVGRKGNLTEIPYASEYFNRFIERGDGAHIIFRESGIDAILIGINSITTEISREFGLVVPSLPWHSN